MRVRGWSNSRNNQSFVSITISAGARVYDMFNGCISINQFIIGLLLHSSSSW